MTECFCVYPSSKESNYSVLKDKIDQCKYKTCCNAQYHSVTYSTMSFFAFVCAETYAHKGTSSVANHNGNSKCHDCEWKNNSVCRISIRTKITCICNKNLVNDVVKGCHKKRNDTWKGIFSHKKPDALS